MSISQGMALFYQLRLKTHVSGLFTNARMRVVTH